MEKTINCAEETCGMAFTYTPNPNYPDKRKYCPKCSAAKKASYAAAQGLKPDVVDAYEPIEHIEPKEKLRVPVEKIPPQVMASPEEQAVRKAWKPEQKEQFFSDKLIKKATEFHLSPEQVRSNALASAIEYWNVFKVEGGDLLDVAKKFEEYILGDDE